jgi:hypothetical protein
MLAAMVAAVTVAALPRAAVAAKHGRLLATGNYPNVAIDAAGTAYVFYGDQLPLGRKDSPLALCVIPAGASGCASRQDILVDGRSGFDPPIVAATGIGQVQVAAGRCCGDRVVALSSSSGGAAFSAPVIVSRRLVEAGAFGPGGQLLLVSRGARGLYASVGTPALPARRAARLISGPLLDVFGAFSGSTPVALGYDVNNDTVGAFWSGAGNVNDGARWKSVRVAGSGSPPGLAQGPGGLYLLQDIYVRVGRRLVSRLVARRFEHRRFGRRHTVANGGATYDETLAEAPNGDLLAVWYRGGSIDAAASTDAGVRWSRPRTLATGVLLPGDLEAALGPGGAGWVVYSPQLGYSVRGIAVNAAALAARGG